MRAANEALLVIDIQNDFCPGGALAVAEGDLIIPQVNALLKEFHVRVLTQDWHPANHSSFAANHPGAAPFSMVEMDYGPQVLWPVHCVQGSAGAEFHADLDVDRADLIIRKGFRPAIDSYSGFYENDRVTPTGLDGYLRSRGVTAVTIVGLATDFCVAYSALDAVGHGFRTTVIESACRAIDLNGSLEDARQQMLAAGVLLEP